MTRQPSGGGKQLSGTQLEDFLPRTAHSHDDGLSSWIMNVSSQNKMLAGGTSHVCSANRWSGNLNSENLWNLWATARSHQTPSWPWMPNKSRSWRNWSQTSRTISQGRVTTMGEQTESTTTSTPVTSVRSFSPLADSHWPSSLEWTRCWKKW
jgi:hypothetical protein